MENSKIYTAIKKIAKLVITSPVNLIFMVAVAFFGIKAYWAEPLLMNKLIFWGVSGLWLFWLIARYMVTLFVFLALLGGGYYAYYQYANREIKKCEASGGEWNKKTKTCEAKSTLAQKIGNIIKDWWDTLPAE